LTLVLLTLLPSQLLFYLQRHLVCVFNHSDYLHIEFILNFVPQAINVSGNFIFVSFPLSISNVQLIELLCVLLHSHTSLSQVLHPPEQTYLVILGYEFHLKLGYHSIPTLDIFFSLSPSVGLQFIPPQHCMSLQSTANMPYLFLLFDILIVEIIFHC